MIGLSDLHFEGMLRPMLRRMHAAKLEPIFLGRPRAVTVHGAVDQNRRHAVDVRL